MVVELHKKTKQQQKNPNDKHLVDVIVDAGLSRERAVFVVSFKADLVNLTF
jgi:mannose/cellobiose epimerase-like protein (N-acyl-D-glucosamine 2-epimerase family)